MSEAQNKLLSKIKTAGMVAQIGANILWESLVHPRPRSIRSVPPSAESLTPEWLTQTLCKDHPGAQVNSVSLGAESSGSTNRRAFSVTYNEAGRAAGLPTNLFNKSSRSGFAALTRREPVSMSRASGIRYKGGRDGREATQSLVCSMQVRADSRPG